MTTSKPLVLVDGSSYLFRAFHALPKLMSTKGANTGAIKGVISMIKKLVKDYEGSHIAVVFDAKGQSFRNEIYPEYKANRAKMPDDLREQIQPIQDIIRSMGLPLIIVEGVEADDVIGTYARLASEAEQSVVISTGDKDMAQLVGEHVTLINTMTSTTMDESGVVEKFGVRPNQIIDYLALVGDTSDNIPGVPKCGPKTAVKWLAAYESLEGVMEHAEEVKGKVGEYLRESIAHLPMSYELATIKLDVELPYTVDELVVEDPDDEALRAQFLEFEFKQWVDELGAQESGEAEPVAKTDYDLVLNEADLDAWIEKLAAAEVFAFDTETTSLDYMEAELVGVSFAVTPGEAAYVPCGHDYEGAPKQIARQTLVDKLRPILEDPRAKKVGQNLNTI